MDNTRVNKSLVRLAMSDPNANRQLRIALFCKSPMTYEQSKRAENSLVGMAELLGVDPDEWLDAAAKLRWKKENPWRGKI